MLLVKEPVGSERGEVVLAVQWLVSRSGRHVGKQRARGRCARLAEGSPRTRGLSGRRCQARNDLHQQPHLSHKHRLWKTVFVKVLQFGERKTFGSSQQERNPEWDSKKS